MSARFGRKTSPPAHRRRTGSDRGRPLGSTPILVPPGEAPPGCDPEVDRRGLAVVWGPQGSMRGCDGAVQPGEERCAGISGGG